ncbi:hypothetical protein PM082_013671 [Marasmius tenuissimus]|nr:hypothetical protein PM082_013671 [Marasmius tenuissimus]
MIENRHHGSGTQNNYNAHDQNINHGRDQIFNVGGDFVRNFNTTVRNPYKTLWGAVGGVGASHNAEQQYARGKCLEGTRREVLRIIRLWLLAKRKEDPICWLSGAAGVGKSAIAMTIAKACEEEGRLVSSFFFFRSDPGRDNPSALVLTIAHGLVSTIPSMRGPIQRRISKDPRILEANLEIQFRKLLLNPTLNRSWLWSLPKLPFVPKVPNIVVIDGLDECSDEPTQLRILSIIQSAVQNTPHFPLRFLICSRPESWIRQAFDARPLRQLSKVIVLDNSFTPSEDIMQYYRHHFREISEDPQYSQVSFLRPWPSEEDLELLVEWSCGQFVYAATTIRFIKGPFRHPIEQLQIILKNIPPRRLGTSPYQQLDALYDHVLSANPDYEEVLPILAAILVLGESATPACIELVLGLPAGQVALTLRGMHSVLNIRGFGDQIRLFHTSFRDYLLDQNRSRHFHIDTSTQTPAIARRWLQNLTTSKVRSYSFNQLYGEETLPFFINWIAFCTSIPKPTRALLDDLWNVDAVSVYLAHVEARYLVKEWTDVFGNLAAWVEESDQDDPNIRENKNKESEKQAGAAESTHRKIIGQHEAKTHSCEMDEESDLVESLLHRFQHRPECFHLELSPGASLDNDIVHWIVSCATGSSYSFTELNRSPLGNVDDVHLTDCRCGLSGGIESRDLGHIVYQEACSQEVKASISLFEELAQTSEDNVRASYSLSHIVHKLMLSSLLKHCRLNAELLSLCRTFFGIARGCSYIQVSPMMEEGRERMLKWIETFPDKFVEDKEALEEHVLTLPWGRWRRNWERDNWSRRSLVSAGSA